MDPNAKIYVAGHGGLVGSAITRRLQDGGYTNLLLRNRQEVDLQNQAQTHAFLSTEKPDYIFLAAAKVGGIYANDTYRADFIYQNLVIETNIIHAAHTAGVERLLFLGSSCIYPRDCPQPIKEDYLLTGPLEQTNEHYAIAKIAGIKLCEAYQQQYGSRYFSAMPTNLYGPGDNFDLETSHVLPALLRKMHEAKINNAADVSVWGSGTPRRELMHVDDLADACVYMMEQDVAEGVFNVGTGKDATIREIAEITRDVVGYSGELEFDPAKPDGTPKKLLDCSKLTTLGWQASHDLRSGIQQTYQWYLDNQAVEGQS